MKCPPCLRDGLVVLSMGLAAVPASAKEDCDAPVSRWQTREALRQWAAAQGWQIQRLKIDDGCYEIRGTDAAGRPFKAKIEPETLKVLKIKSGEHLRERAHRRADEGPAPPGGPLPAESPRGGGDVQPRTAP